MDDASSKVAARLCHRSALSAHRHKKLHATGMCGPAVSRESADSAAAWRRLRPSAVPRRSRDGRQDATQESVLIGLARAQ